MWRLLCTLLQKVPGFSPLFATEGVFGTRARGVFAFTTARISRRFNLADLVADTTAENAFFKVMANRETRFFRIFDRVRTQLHVFLTTASSVRKHVQRHNDLSRSAARCFEEEVLSPTVRYPYLEAA